MENAGCKSPNTAEVNHNEFRLVRALQYAKRPLNLHRTRRVTLRLDRIKLQIRRIEDTLPIIEQVANFFESPDMRQRAIETAHVISERIRPLMEQAEAVLQEAADVLRSGMFAELRDDVERVAGEKLREVLGAIEEELRALLVRGGHR